MGRGGFERETREREKSAAGVPKEKLEYFFYFLFFLKGEAQEGGLTPHGMLALLYVL